VTLAPQTKRGRPGAKITGDVLVGESDAGYLLSKSRGNVDNVQARLVKVILAGGDFGRPAFKPALVAVVYAGYYT
jgi:hypothetical protein